MCFCSLSYPKGGICYDRTLRHHWRQCGAHHTWAIALDPNDPDCWLISACPGPREAHNPKGNAQAYIYRWRGNGPWQALDGGLPQPLTNFPYALASVPGQLYAGLSDGCLYMSHDLGDSWQQLSVSGDTLPSILALACVA